ncbi:MAG: hypothetical protein AVDCRST_MAG49-184 [uncultured Thermomicrobiales bacterium]|uniref:Integral membrane protein n=1 Tax=uncultured Thermomicrobiales bacterium TaxID=1645740 RepID=A0A6J4TZB6_9BACT|nr:MAG: hypothetical protein AVDCRST_MAG49-184 [uncultured Thermomicrobiales bacterium]
MQSRAGPRLTATSPWTGPRPSSGLLRRALLVDAATGGGTAALMLLAADPLGDLLGLSPLLLRGAGAGLVPFVALLIGLAMRHTVATGATLAAIGVNVLWSLGSLLLLVTGDAEPTAIGVVYVAGQAMAVALFALAQAEGLRRVGSPRA